MSSLICHLSRRVACHTDWGGGLLPREKGGWLLWDSAAVLICYQQAPKSLLPLGCGGGGSVVTALTQMPRTL